MGRARLHQACLIILTGLAIQLALGMILNLYIAVPAGDARASYLREIETAPAMLTAHALRLQAVIIRQRPAVRQGHR
ncbi:MAG: hypothetical protein ACRDN0_14315 [Trebonia sp.]